MLQSVEVGPAPHDLEGDLLRLRHCRDQPPHTLVRHEPADVDHPQSGVRAPKGRPGVLAHPDAVGDDGDVGRPAEPLLHHIGQEAAGRGDGGGAPQGPVAQPPHRAEAPDAGRRALEGGEAARRETQTPPSLPHRVPDHLDHDGSAAEAGTRHGRRVQARGVHDVVGVAMTGEPRGHGHLPHRPGPPSWESDQTRTHGHTGTVPQGEDRHPVSPLPQLPAEVVAVGGRAADVRWKDAAHDDDTHGSALRRHRRTGSTGLRGGMRRTGALIARVTSPTYHLPAPHEGSRHRRRRVHRLPSRGCAPGPRRFRRRPRRRVHGQHRQRPAPP